MRQLTLLQRQRLTLSLFFAVAMGAVVTVAAPAFVPWQVVDEKREQALEQQRRQGIDYHIVPNPRRRKGSVPETSDQSDNKSSSTAMPSSSSSPLPLSTFSGALLHPNRIPLASTSDVELARRQLNDEHGSTNPSSMSNGSALEQQQDGDEGTRKRRRRRRRKKVNEGWQELTGRTAREEKAKAEAAAAAAAVASGSSISIVEQGREDQKATPPARTLGPNGGQEIEWKNKKWQHCEPV